VVRTPAEDDIPAILGLINEHRPDPLDEDSLQRQWSAPWTELEHPHSVQPDLGWIRVLGVRRPWRGCGRGRALLLHAFREFRRRGFARAGLGVDAESPTGANRLYESVGMRVSARFEIYEKQVS
jgi:ribosomal protein S18 acetylase RimI-like enzyme